MGPRLRVRGRPDPRGLGRGRRHPAARPARSARRTRSRSVVSGRRTVTYAAARGPERPSRSPWALAAVVVAVAAIVAILSGSGTDIRPAAGPPSVAPQPTRDGA